ncbi:MAG TPA: helix-turn-helix domain-containing protein [Candidatus Dormibacteraeota bacterium]|nr:helix-turn-helix domain-containing protein [Candidatus Dormibacteraeota bacterium]
MSAVEPPTVSGWKADLPAPAVGRAFVVLERVFGGTRSISALARELGVSKGSVHAVVRSLLAVGALTTAPDGSLRIGEKLRELAAGKSAPELRSVQPVLDRLAREHPELTFYFGVPDAEGIVVHARSGHSAGFAQTAPVGARLPRGAGAIGKVLLAAGRAPYACDDQEYLQGVRTVAAPVVRGDSVAAVLWLAGPAGVLRKQEMSVLGERLHGAAAELAEQL